MATENVKGDSTENSPGSENPDNQEYYERVRKLLRPVENRWQYIQSVLLWQKPTHSLSYFIAMTILVGIMASGKFRLVLLLIIIMASSLLMEDIRCKVWQCVQGGFNALTDEDSRQITLSFPRLCGRLAAIWSCLATWREKLNKLKAESRYRYYAVLFALILVVVFAYQYVPLLPIFYVQACALYLWPAIKYNGIHIRMERAVEPFYRPFVVQWQNTRTKRTRDTTTTGTKGEMPADSDDEFAKDLSPVTDDTVGNQDKFVPPQDEAFSESEPSSSAPPVEVKLLEGLISSAITQGLSSITSRKDSQGTEGTSAQDTPEHEGESPSLDSSAVFLDNLQFSSISQSGDTLEFEEGDFIRGLEFPDIERDSESDSEVVQPAGKSHVDSKPTHSKQTEEAMDLKEQVNLQTSETLESVMKESVSSDVSDYEMLDQSEAEGMIPTDQTDNGNSSPLGSATNYVGKWLGY
ncbi:reticulophagy regulator 3-like [Stylophora pistillata]|uniref:Protein FAM134C n=1 Tax=Stylophora pistillata TaxID=50429 RepID=A0A2B4SVJ7_STYPI|nr:reticulophagy regulator 3-like [Stylophora pistillata]PFX33209.1 Protein FAM134C [Stylophora pistillata]